MKVDRSYINRYAIVEEYRRRNTYIDDQFCIDAEGCLDAPDVIPAGGCFSREITDFEVFLPDLLLIFRD